MIIICPCGSRDRSFRRSFFALFVVLINPLVSQGGSRERRGARGKAKKGKVVKTRNWVLAKKDQQRRQGRDVRDDNKFTGRKRKDKF